MKTPFEQLKDKFNDLENQLRLDNRQSILLHRFLNENFREAYQQQSISRRELERRYDFSGLKEHLTAKSLYVLAEFMKKEGLYTEAVFEDDWGNEITRVNMVFFEVENEKK